MVDLPTPSTPGGVFAEIAPTGKVVVGVNTNGHLIYSDVPAHGNDGQGATGVGGTTYAWDVGVDPSGMRNVTATSLQDALVELDAAVAALRDTVARMGG